ncbi:MAG: hemolysin family protein [Chloroflexi bacterium]|nr:hemolysin family protein [Chloroflexota bacterium]
MGNTLVEIGIIVLLVMLNAVFVSAEIALVSLRRSRVDQLVEEGRRGAARVRRLTSDPGRFLAVIQLAITFIGFLASAFAGVSLAVALSDLLVGVGIASGPAAVVSLLGVTILLSLFTIVFGELVPKTLALAHPEIFALRLAGPVDILGRALRPLVAFLTAATRAITRLFGAEVTSEAQITADELRLIVDRGGEQGVLEAEERQMINAVIELGSRRVHEVMVPRIAIVGLPASATFDDAIDTIIEEGHSRVPVYDNSLDEVVGILYAKDLLPFLKSDAAARSSVRTMLRTPVFVPESMSIDDLLHEFQRRKVHLAIVLDEYGGTAGLVTIEDLLEEIVGEIQDEYDEEEPLIEQLDDDRVRVDGRASIDDLLDLWDMKPTLEDEDEYDTVGGFVYHRIGGVPIPGDEIQLEHLRMTVETTDGRRVGKVLVVREHDADEGSADNGDEG